MAPLPQLNHKNTIFVQKWVIFQKILAPLAPKIGPFIEFGHLPLPFIGRSIPKNRILTVISGDWFKNPKEGYWTLQERTKCDIFPIKIRKWDHKDLIYLLYKISDIHFRLQLWPTLFPKSSNILAEIFQLQKLHFLQIFESKISRWTIPNYKFSLHFYLLICQKFSKISNFCKPLVKRLPKWKPLILISNMGWRIKKITQNILLTVVVMNHLKYINIPFQGNL